jgi:hypothetical protein
MLGTERNQIQMFCPEQFIEQDNFVRVIDAVIRNQKCSIFAAFLIPVHSQRTKFCQYLLFTGVFLISKFNQKYLYLANI